MKYERELSAAGSIRRPSMVVIASMLGAATILAIAHLHAQASRDAISSMHAAWIRIAAPGTQLPAGRLTLRVVKLWATGAIACYIPRLGPHSWAHL